MINYNDLSFYLQFTINITLLIGMGLFLNEGKYCKKLLLFFLLGELVMEFSDLFIRLMDINNANIYLYPFSQCFGLLMITKIYDCYFFTLPKFIIRSICLFAGLSFVVNLIDQQNVESFRLYFNIITNIFICCFSGIYFLNIIRYIKIDKNLFILNIFIFLFFSVESIISTTFNFLINNHLEWVAPIWLFRGLLLWLLYISFINLGCHLGKVKIL